MNALLACAAVDNCPHARPASVERDMPEPAMRIRLNKNIGRVRPWQTPHASEIGVDRQILKKCIPAAQLQLPSQERALATGVYYETSPGHPGRVIGRVVHPHRSTVGPQDVHDLMALPDIHAVRPTVLQKQLVEEGAPDLVRMRVCLIRFTEIPAPGCLIRTPDHSGAPF